MDLYRKLERFSTLSTYPKECGKSNEYQMAKNKRKTSRIRNSTIYADIVRNRQLMTSLNNHGF